RECASQDHAGALPNYPGALPRQAGASQRQAGLAMRTPRVSVVTPFTDQGPFIGAAIASVRAQSFEAWELVLVDDGARDGSRAIAERAAAAGPARIRVVATTSPGGAAAARNHGIRVARGDLVAFLDADD